MHLDLRTVWAETERAVGGCRSFAQDLVIPLPEAYGRRVMIVAEVRQLPLAEKLQVMEAVWEEGPPSVS